MTGKRLMKKLKKKLDDHVDQFSKLPDDILRRILSFLPSVTAVRTSILSKRWIRTWNSVPTINCSISRDPRDYIEIRTSSKFMENFLKHRDADASVTKLHLEVGEDTSTDLDRWLTCVCEKTVEVLDLHIRNYLHICWCLPQRFYNARSLTVLKLARLQLEATNDFCISFPSLKSLSLIDVIGMNDQMLHSLLLGSPSLEILILMYCPGLLDPQISSSTLKIFEFEAYKSCLRTIRVSCSGLKSLSFVFWGHYDAIIQVLGAENLDSSQYDGAKIPSHSTVKLGGCSKVEKLSITGVSLHDDDKYLEDLVSGLPLLETLELKHCRIFRRHLRILSKNLKNLFLEYIYRWPRPPSAGEHLVEDVFVTIDAPNLVSLNLNNKTLLNFSMKAPRLLESTITLQQRCTNKAIADDEWHFSLIEFLSKVGCCKNLRLNCFAHKTGDLIFPEKVKESVSPPLLDVKNIEVKVQKLEMENSELMIKNSVRWMAPSVETLSVKAEFDQGI